MEIVSHSLFAEHFRANSDIGPDSAHSVQADEVQVLMSKDLDSDIKEWQEKELELIGRAEFAGKGNHGVGVEACAQAVRVGATLVLFSLWPAKFRAIKHLADGSIDMAAVLADPPAYLSPKGYFVLKAVFMRPNKSLHTYAVGAGELSR